MDGVKLHPKINTKIQTLCYNDFREVHIIDTKVSGLRIQFMTYI